MNIQNLINNLINENVDIDSFCDNLKTAAKKKSEEEKEKKENEALIKSKITEATKLINEAVEIAGDSTSLYETIINTLIEEVGLDKEEAFNELDMFFPGVFDLIKIEEKETSKKEEKSKKETSTKKKNSNIEADVLISENGKRNKKAEKIIKDFLENLEF